MKLRSRDRAEARLESRRGPRDEGSKNAGSMNPHKGSNISGSKYSHRTKARDRSRRAAR